MSELRPPLRDQMPDMFSSADADELVATLQARPRQTRETRQGGRRWVVAAAACALMVMGGYSLFARRTGTMATAPSIRPAAGPLKLMNGALPGTVVAAGAHATALSFADGSTLVVSEPSDYATQPKPKAADSVTATLRTTINTSDEITFALDSGSVELAVAPGGPRVWRIRTDLAEIEVLGTKFRVTRGPDFVRVSVQHGKVAVRSAFLEPRLRVLTDEQSIVVRRPNVNAVPDDATDAGVADAPTEPEAVPVRRRWRRMAREKKFNKAYEILGTDGIVRETKRARTVSQLFDLSDVARSSGHPEDAIEPLAHLVRRFPHDPRAGTAAFTLGRIHMTKNRYGAAAAAFERAIVLGVSPSLQEAAYVRAIQMHRAARNTEGAHKAIRRYLSRFPRGHHVERVKAWRDEPLQ